MDRAECDFEAIHAAYRQRILRYLARLAGPGEAEDLTQEVFSRVSRGLPGFKGDASLPTWIYRIASNVAADRLRSRSFRESRSADAVSPCPGSSEGADGLPDEKSLPAERQLARTRMSSCIHGYIDVLPENYRAVVILSDIEGLTNREIAQVLGLTLETVKIRLHRGRTKLKEMLRAGCRFDRNEDDVLVCDPKKGN